MTDPRRLTDHTETMLAELLPRWRASPRMLALTDALTAGVQIAEDVTYRVIVERYLASCIGAQLDNYAVLFGELRNGRGDEELRDFIFAKIIAIHGGSTPEAVAELAAILFSSGAPFGVRYIHNKEAAYQLQTTPFEEGPDLHTDSNAVSTSSESAAFTGWLSTGAAILATDEDAFEGTHAFKATAATAAGACLVYQFATVAGRAYRVSLAARRGALGTNQSISGWFALDGSPNILIDSEEWQQYTFDVFATGVLAQVKICATSAGGAVGDIVWLDAFEIRELIPTVITADQIAEAAKLLLLATPAGVQLTMISQSSPSLSFRFGSGAVGPRGFGNAPFSSLLVNEGF